MFLLQKVFSKSKRLSGADDTPPQRAYASPRRRRSLRVNSQPTRTVSEAESPSPVVEAQSEDPNHGVDTNNLQQSTALSTHFDATDQTDSADKPETPLRSRPPSPTVIAESPTNGALMSGQSDVAHSMLSACNDLPPLPDALVTFHHPRYMPTDPSPFNPSITGYVSSGAAEVVENTLYIGSHLKLVVDGQEFRGKVTEIHRANNMLGPPGEDNCPIPTSPRPQDQPPSSYKAWCAGDQIPPVQKWVNDVTQREQRKISNPQTRPNFSPDPPEGVGAGTNGPAPRPGDPGQPFGVAAVELPGTNHLPGTDTIPVRIPEPSLWGTQGAVIHDREGVQPGQDEPPRTWRIPRWQYTEINPEKTYQCGGILGKGSFGKVYLVLRTRDKRHFAMKIHDLRHARQIRTARALLKELYAQHLIAERRFLSGVIDVWYSSANFLHVITEHCPGGDLLSHVRKLTDKQMLLVIAEVILGLISLHDQGIIHQDIKPDNILIDGEGHCVITDFGLSSIADEQTGLSMARQKPPGGTLEYMAPEIVLEGGGKFPPGMKMVYWDFGVDYWSLGATIFHLQTGELITQFYEEGWKSKLTSPAVRQPLVHHHTPSSLIALVEKFTKFDRTRRWKGPRVKEADYFKPLNSSATGWYDIYAKKYAPFRTCYAKPVQSDMASIIGPYNDPRARPGEHRADMNELIQALQSRRITIRKDDSLMPGKDFIPRLYPDDLTKK